MEGVNSPDMSEPMKVDATAVKTLTIRAEESKWRRSRIRWNRRMSLKDRMQMSRPALARD